MDFYLYNAIRTPDGTVLWCKTGHDFQTHVDAVTGETYINDGCGYSIRRSVNKTEAEDLSVKASDPFETVRHAKFWGSYGRDGKGPKTILSLAEIDDAHIQAILDTQRQIRGTPLEELFCKEQAYRAAQALDLAAAGPNSPNKRSAP